ncbi:thioesterase II family protein [Streptomyces sclerotialus]|uniref:thioesterase II family protein n=1 Tax=Streptomyces sclerotialus TaxID=1957 RepID=UPI0004CA63DC
MSAPPEHRAGAPAPLRIGPSDPAVRVLALHHAGGSAAAFLPLLPHLPAECELVLLELPNRAARPGLSPDDFEDALRGLAAQAHPLVDRPTVVLGHSLGALFAHSVTASLPAHRQRLVHALILSASPFAPQDGIPPHRRPPAPFAHRTEAQLTEDLRLFGGSPDALFADPARLADAVRLLGLDMHLTDTYPGGPAVPVPHHLWHGLEDPTHVPGVLSRSADSAASVGAGAEVRAFPGGHFFLFSGQEPAAELGRIAAAAARATR